MDGETFFKTATAFKDLVTALGICIGGVWAYFRFVLERGRETALGMDLACRTVPYGPDSWLAFLDVTLTNCGKVQLRARKEEPAYQRVGLHHQYGLGLKIRRVPSGLAEHTLLDWWQPGWSELRPEVNLLKGYLEVEGGGTQTDFWMEPGESYALSAPLVLGEGSYLVAVTFVGASEKVDEFWQRIFLVQVPTASSS